MRGLPSALPVPVIGSVRGIPPCGAAYFAHGGKVGKAPAGECAWCAGPGGPWFAIFPRTPGTWDVGYTGGTAGAQSAPLRKGRREPAGAASSRPKSFPPSWGDGVTAYAATDEGASVPRPASIGRAGLGPVPAQRRGPLMGTAGAQRPKGTRRGGFQPSEKHSPGGKVSRRMPRRMRGLPSHVPHLWGGQV